MTVFEFLVHYWLFTTATLACVWVITVHFLRSNSIGTVGRQLARREDKRIAKYRAAVAEEAAVIEPHEPA